MIKSYQFSAGSATTVPGAYQSAVQFGPLIVQSTRSHCRAVVRPHARPTDDFHVHLRDGAGLASWWCPSRPGSSPGAGDANQKPPVTSVAMAAGLSRPHLQALPAGSATFRAADDAISD